MAKDQRVLLNVKNNIAYVTLNRPEKHNGLDRGMFLQLASTAKKIRKDLSIRAVIMQGSGESFCTGLDFEAVSKSPTMFPRFFAKLPWSRDNTFQRAANIWRDLPIPVIAAVHGNCIGGGLQLMLACDYRIATPDSNMSILEVNWGLAPDMSGMVNLSGLIRKDIAQELTMTGRFFNGNEALEYGFVSKVSNDPMEGAEAMAKQIASKSPDAVAAIKHLFKKTWKKDARSALFWERITQLGLLLRKNTRIAMANGMAKKDSAPKPFINRTAYK